MEGSAEKNIASRVKATLHMRAQQCSAHPGPQDAAPATEHLDATTPFASTLQRHAVSLNLLHKPWQYDPSSLRHSQHSASFAAIAFLPLKVR